MAESKVEKPAVAPAKKAAKAELHSVIKNAVMDSTARVTTKDGVSIRRTRKGLIVGRK
jgi:hypothetical protein